MTDEQKLEFIKSEFNAYISNIETLTQFKSFLNNIDKAKVITALKTKIQEHIDTHSGYAVSEQERVDELRSFKNNLDQYLQ